MHKGIKDNMKTTTDFISKIFTLISPKLMQQSKLQNLQFVPYVYNVEVDAYHGGQFNGVGYPNIIHSIEGIIPQTINAFISERKKPSDISDTEVLKKT